MDSFPVPLPCKVLPSRELRDLAKVIKNFSNFHKDRALFQLNKAESQNPHDTDFCRYQVHELEAFILAPTPHQTLPELRLKERAQAQLRHLFHVEFVFNCEMALRVVKFLLTCAHLGADGYIQPIRTRESTYEHYALIRNKVEIHFQDRLSYEIDPECAVPLSNILNFMPLAYEMVERIRKEVPLAPPIHVYKPLQDLMLEHLFYQI